MSRKKGGAGRRTGAARSRAGKVKGRERAGKKEKPGDGRGARGRGVGRGAGREESDTGATWSHVDERRPKSQPQKLKPLARPLTPIDRSI